MLKYYLHTCSVLHIVEAKREVIKKSKEKSERRSALWVTSH